MSTGRKVWLGLLLAGGAFELRAVLDPKGEDTLSEFTRWAFRTHTKAGAVTFAVAALSFGGWFIPHILRKKKDG
jgi:hypothetical protein